MRRNMIVPWSEEHYVQKGHAKDGEKEPTVSSSWCRSPMSARRGRLLKKRACMLIGDRRQQTYPLVPQRIGYWTQHEVRVSSVRKKTSNESCILRKIAAASTRLVLGIIIDKEFGNFDVAQCCSPASSRCALQARAWTARFFAEVKDR